MLKKPIITLTLLLTASLLFAALSGCGKKKEQPKLVAVTEATFPPYEYMSGNRICGIDPDILKEVASKLGYELIIENMSFNSIIAAVQSGKADIAASGITVTEDRKKMIDFTVPYAESAQLIIVPRSSKIKSPEELHSLKVGVQQGTTGDQYLTGRFPKNQPERYENGALAVAALRAGKIHAVVLDAEPARIHVSHHQELTVLPEPLTSEEYAFAIRKGRPELLDAVNRELKRMKADGTLAKIIDHQKKLMAAGQGKSDDSGIWQNIKDSFYLNFIKDHRYKYLVNGFIVTLEISICSVIIGILIGFIVAVIRSTADQTGKFKLLNIICRLYLTVVRGTPVIVQLLIIYFVIFGSVNVSKVLVAIIAFGINSGAYVAEIIRSGIMSIDRGQMEAARSLGLSYPRAMIYVILPQALKNVLPALGNEFVVLLKETSVSGYIALQDLTKGGDIIRSQTYDAFLPLIAVALIYLAVVMLFSGLLNKLEERLKKNE